MSIAELQVYSVEEADVSGGVCVVRCIGGVARAGQVYAAGESRLGLRRIERYGRPVGFFDAGHVAKVHLTGAVVALLTRGQVLTSVPPDGHALGELEAWLATDPPLEDEPHPLELRTLAVGRAQADRLPDEVRLRWGRVALAATRRKAARAGEDALVAAAEEAAVRGYLIQQFGAGPGGDPAELCRDLLALIDMTPGEAAHEARSWRDLPRARILHLRRIKNLLPWLALVRPELAPDDPLGASVDAWSAVRPRLP
ncbi:hypothetical protein OHS33_17830 [Streptomyces sp. NBC_00536]|uniref:hypothetical protein n=1 Tax=Streptomyces sp. NBC_00536 TaxID=2975769 RepID=UPI002E810CB7|nr:hypothetical protein [Streptomyces sp. NBC_00536]WUC80042.1 hypothetical protein OHS33_17830 [Streptomyces sp. NBC_00536]